MNIVNTEIMSDFMVSEHFDVRELVSKKLFMKWGARSRWFVPQTYIDALEFLRKLLNDHYGRKVYMVVNNWHAGGRFQYRGFRDKTWSNVSKSDSLHKQCLGGDFNAYFSGGDMIPIVEVYELLKSKEKELLEHGITTLENVEFTKGWIHFDMRNTGMDELLIVNP